MDIIQERIQNNVCPLCAKEIKEEKIVQDNKYGQVKICNHHIVQGEKNECKNA